MTEDLLRYQMAVKADEARYAGRHGDGAGPSQHFLPLLQARAMPRSSACAADLEA